MDTREHIGFHIKLSFFTGGPHGLVKKDYMKAWKYIFNISNKNVGKLLHWDHDFNKVKCS